MNFLVSLAPIRATLSIRPMPHSSTALPPRRSFRHRSWLTPLLLGAAALGLALAARFLWIEPKEMGLACLPDPPPWWCTPRLWVVYVHQYNGWGIVALATGIVALVARWYPLALVGLAAGLVGLVLYNAGLAAVGLIASLLLILRR